MPIHDGEAQPYQQEGQQGPQQSHHDMWLGRWPGALQGRLYPHGEIPGPAQAHQEDGRPDLLNGENYSTIHMVLPTIKDIKNHIDGFKKDKVIGETAKYLSKEFDDYFR